MRLLYIEDNPQYVTLVEDSLQASETEFILTSVDTLKEGIARLEENPHDVILLDWDLPDSGGLDGLRDIIQRFPEVPVVVLTEQDDDTKSIEAIQAGAQNYFIKGKFPEELLICAIRHAIERKKISNALEKSELQWTETFRAISDSVFVLNSDGIIIQVNETFTEHVHLDKSQILGRRCCELIHNSSEFIPDCPFERMTKSQKREQHIARFVDQWLEITIDPIFDKDGKLQGAVHVMKDITEHMAYQNQQNLTARVLEILNNSLGRADVIGDILRMIKKTFNFDAVGIRLKEGPDFPYYETIGFSEDFIRSEKYLCARNENGEVIVDTQGNPIHECMCGNILDQRFDTEQVFFTEGGSFWTNSTTELMATTTEKERQSRTRNRCHSEGYESVALIPLKSNHQVIGLLQLNDQKKYRFSLELIQYFEGLGINIGIALARKEAEEENQHINRVLRAVRNVNKLIVDERDEQKLIQQACDILFVTRGYNSAWFALLDETRKPVHFAQAGLDDKFEPLKKYMDGQLNACCRGAMEQPGIVLIDDQISDCSDCPLIDELESTICMTIRLGSDLKIYGLLSVNIPGRFGRYEEEQDLLNEVAGDIAFALHEIELEKQWQASEEEKIETLESIADAFLSLNNQLKITYYNGAAERQLNKSAAEVVGNSFFEVFPEMRGSVFEKKFLKVMQDKQPEAFETYFDVPPYRDWYEVRVYPQKKGISVYFLVTTERKSAEEALDKERRLFKALMDNIPDHIYFKDRESRFITVNRAQAERFGFDCAERMIGKTDFDFFSEEHARKAFEDEQQIIKTGDSLVNVEEKETWPHQAETWVSTTKMPLMDKNGKITGTFGISRDITRRKQAEEQIRKSLGEKEILLRELYHRTKNNMQVISSMLRLKARAYQDKGLRFTFREIENKIRSMALVHQKLYESQNLSSLNLKSYFSDLIALIRKSYSIDRDRIKIHYQAEDIHVLIDTAIPLGLVMNELLSNVFKHAFPEDRKGDIHIELTQGSSESIVIEVRDNGVGFPAGLDINKTDSLGMVTIFDLVRYQLDSQVSFISDHGVKCRIVIRKELYEPRV